jgi:hypothetical protein
MSLTFEWYANSITVGVGLDVVNYSLSIVIVVIILTAAPWSINVFVMGTFLITTLTTGFPKSPYYKSWVFST